MGRGRNHRLRWLAELLGVRFRVCDDDERNISRPTRNILVGPDGIFPMGIHTTSELCALCNFPNRSDSDESNIRISHRSCYDDVSPVVRWTSS